MYRIKQIKERLYNLERQVQCHSEYIHTTTSYINQITKQNREILKKLDAIPATDLEEEIKNWVYNPMLELNETQEAGKELICVSIKTIEDTARHFFELGKKIK